MIHRPGFVVADVRAPRMGGYELCRNIKAIRPMKDTHVLLSAEAAWDVDEEKGKQSGAELVATGPHWLDDLLAHIRSRIESPSPAVTEDETPETVASAPATEVEPEGARPIEQAPRGGEPEVTPVSDRRQRLEAAMARAQGRETRSRPAAVPPVKTAAGAEEGRVWQDRLAAAEAAHREALVQIETARGEQAAIAAERDRLAEEVRSLAARCASRHAEEELLAASSEALEKELEGLRALVASQRDLDGKQSREIADLSTMRDSLLERVAGLEADLLEARSRAVGSNGNGSATLFIDEEHLAQLLETRIGRAKAEVLFGVTSRDALFRILGALDTLLEGELSREHQAQVEGLAGALAQAASLLDRIDEGSGLPVREPRGTHDILVVDDNSFTRRLTQKWLEQLGYGVDAASGAGPALDACHRFPYRAILLDVVMPERDGLAAAQGIRAVPGHARTPIIALSGNPDIGSRERCLAAGMSDHMTKPVMLAEMRTKLVRWLGPPPAGGKAA
jgi:CheY-like chemotaxis protein